MRFCSLGSGSTGNSTLIEAGDPARPTRLLVDCGFSLRELSRRLALRGVEPGQIDAVFVTHEHGDHVGCALTLTRRHGTPLWMSAGTWEGLGAEQVPAALNIAVAGKAIPVGALQLNPFAVPHDAREPLQLRVGDGARHLGVLTDLGEAGEDIARHLQHCDALLLEANHDRELLAAGPYPAFLKRRVGGRHGHLENSLSAQLLRLTRHARLRHVVAAHLSQQNNRPELAAAALAGALGTGPDQIVVADALHGSPWLDLH